MKIEFSIQRMHGADDGKVVRIDIRKGAKVLCRLKMPIESFTNALFGEAGVSADVVVGRLLDAKEAEAVRERG